MKKVGIATFFRNNNFGAVLQAYALQEIILSLGYEPEILNYSPSNLDKVPFLARLASIGKKVLLSPVRIRTWMRNRFKSIPAQRAAFDNFRRRFLRTSPQFSTVDAVKSWQHEYFACIAGSDQVWNPQIAGVDPVFLLSFISGNRRISYAASFGLNQLPENDMQIMAPLMKDFFRISVREHAGAKILLAMGIDAPAVVLDPTLLFDQNFWQEREIRPSIARPYLLSYLVGERHGEVCRFIEEIAQAYQLPLVVLNPGVGDFRIPFTSIATAGPREFLGLISGAAGICTDSYHGTVFSLNYGKPFFTLDAQSKTHVKSRRSRMDTLFDTIGVKGRFLESPFVDSGEFLNCISNVWLSRLTVERGKSIDFLRRALHEIPNV